MKTAKVVSVKGDGTWKEFYKFEVELDNGDSGVMYKKTPQHWLEENQEINYSINDKGTLKVIREGWNNNPSSNGSFGSNSKDGINPFELKDKRISRQCALKCAIEIAVSKGVYTPDEILGQAEQFVEWICEENNGSENKDSENNAPF